MDTFKRSYFGCFRSVAALPFLVVAAALFMPSSGYAAGGASKVLEELTVIARKKSDAEVAQDVPIALTTYGAGQLDALFVQRLDDLSYTAPNVQLEQVGTFPGVQNFSIRGQGINSSIPSVDPTVGVFIDGIYMGTTFGVVIDMFDVESLEILRGPQGLLFGRNVTGGAVLLRTARPDGEFGAKIRGQATADDRYGIAAAIEGALVPDVLAGKLVAYYDKDDGYFKNTNPSSPAPQPVLEMLDPDVTNFYPATGRDIGEYETTLIRPTLVWTATDELDLTLIGEYGNSEGDGGAWTNVTEQRLGLQPEFSTTADEVGTTDIEWQQLTFELNWDVPIGDGTITNIMGWRDVEALSIADIDGSFAPLFTAPGDTSQDQISNELRYSGTFMESWDVTVGLYYFEQDIRYRERRFIGGGAGANFSGPPLMLPFPGFNLALGGDMNHKTYGVFWSNDIRVSETITLTAGIRYSDEEKKAQIIDDATGCADVVAFNCSFSNLKGDWQNLTPKLGIDWRFADDAMLYAFWAQGVRSGGFNFRNARPNLPPLSLAPGPTKEEKQDSFEAGIKSDWFDNRVRVNFAAFYNKIDDIQRELNVGDPVVVVLQGTVNAGDVTIKGVELDVATLIVENFALDASIGIQDGKYDNVSGSLPPGTIGSDLPRLAPWNYSIGATYDVFLGNAGVVTLRGNYGFRDKHPYNDSNSEIFSSQRRASVSVNYTSPEDHWRISLYGKNLKDEANWGNLTSIAGLYTAGPMQKGRDYGVEVTYTF